MVPSKAVILNKIWWRIFERRAKKVDDMRTLSLSMKTGNEKDCTLSALEISTFTRKQFPYFNDNEDGNTDTERKSLVLLENAGGSQNPSQVIDCVVEALSHRHHHHHRHRSIIGQISKDEAQKITMTILGGSQDTHRVFLGANTSSVFESLSSSFVEALFMCHFVITITWMMLGG